MPIPNKTQVRGIKSIRTNVSRVDRITKPHLAYLRIGSLEMERSRKQTELKAAMEKVREIERRCREIDAEKQYLLYKIGEGPLPEHMKSEVVERPVRVTKERDTAPKTEHVSGQSKDTEKENRVQIPAEREIPRGMSVGGTHAGGSNGSFKLRY